MTEVVSRYVPRLAGDQIRFIGASDFSTWEVDGQFMVRFAFNEGSDAQLRLEVAALPVLAAYLPISVPQVEFVGATDDGRPVIGYPKLLGTDGEHFRPAPLLIGLGATLAGERRWPLDLVHTQIKWAFAESDA